MSFDVELGFEAALPCKMSLQLNNFEMFTGEFRSNKALKIHMRDAQGIKPGRRGKLVPCSVAERHAGG